MAKNMQAPRDVIPRYLALLFCSVVLLSVGCGSSANTTTSVTAPAVARCQANVGMSSSTFAATGGTGSVSIGITRDCSWKAATPVNWITFTSSVEGQGEGTVTFNVAPNADPVTRQASISVAERNVSISQQPAPCSYAIGGVPTVLTAQAGSAEIDLRTHAACSWTAASESSWASVSPA